MENVTKNEIYKKVQSVTCAASSQGNQFLFWLITINIVLAFTAALGNAVVLVALRRISSLKPASKVMFRCLVVTDLCVGLFAQPLYAVQLSSIVNQQIRFCGSLVSANNIIGNTLSGVSLFVLTAISLDRLFALSLGLTYKHVITLSRTHRMIVCIWLFNFSLSNLRQFWENVFLSKVMSATICSALAFSAISYSAIYIKLRKHRSNMQGSVQQGQLNERTSAFNIARYRKTVYTALCVQFALVACYLPYGVTVALAHTQGYNPSINFTVRLTISFVFLNSSLNPFLYCWRIRGVRKAVKEIVRCPCSLST